MDRGERIERVTAEEQEARLALHESRFDEAAEGFARAVEGWTELGGPDCEEAMTARGFLGRALTEARRYEEAEQVLGALLVDRERVLGPDDEQTLVARGNLMRAVAFGGRPREAIVIAERLMADRARIHGEDSAEVHRTRAHIARFHLEMGDHAEAARQYRLALGALERIGADAGSGEWDMRYNLAVAEARAEPNEETLGALEAFLVTLAAHHGDDDAPAVVTGRAVLAEIWAFQAGQPGRAIPVLIDVVEWRRRTFGASSPATLSALRLLARCLVVTGRPGEAVGLLEDGVTAAAAAGVDREVLGLSLRSDLIWARCELLVRVADGDDPDEVERDIAREQYGAVVAEYRSLEHDSRFLEPGHGLRRSILSLVDDYGFDPS